MGVLKCTHIISLFTPLPYLAKNYGSAAASGSLLKKIHVVGRARDKFQDLFSKMRQTFVEVRDNFQPEILAYIDATNRIWYLSREYKSEVEKEIMPRPMPSGISTAITAISASNHRQYFTYFGYSTLHNSDKCFPDWYMGRVASELGRSELDYQKACLAFGPFKFGHETLFLYVWDHKQQ
ncbi:hypothetical protein LguiB_017787 [Lonicera macranthoides]